MKLSLVFRTGMGLCLALSTACLGYIERFHLDANGVTAFYVSVGALILMAFLVEDRWVMPALMANLLGIAIAIGWMTWFFSDVPTPGGGLDAKTWILPRLGPLLTILLLAKFLRPKHPADYWVLQGLALVQVTLACVLADAARRGQLGAGDKDPVFVFLLLGYLGVGVWSMLVFYLHRESISSESHRPHRQPTAPPAAPVLRLPWRFQGIRQAAVWTLFGGVFSLLLFLLVPWPGKGEKRGDVGRARSVQTGFSPDINLNNTPRIQINREVALRVEAHNALGERVNLSADIRWRGTACAVYQNGRWHPHFTRDIETAIEADEFIRPNRDDVRLVCQVDLSVVRTGRQRLGRPVTPLFFAEPIVRDESGGPALRNPQGFLIGEAGLNPFESTVMLEGRANTVIRYEQLYRPAAKDSDWTPHLGKEFPHPYRLDLTFIPGEDKKGFPPFESRRRATEILKKAGAERDSAEKKARALASYLSHSGEYTYSLEGLGPNTTRDPTVEFLCEVKRGHCQFFASALALMLRSQNIPARVVIGYRGCDWNPRRELYEVRQEHAHAWVEALVPRKDRLGNDVEGWLTLDPTPVFDLNAVASGASRAAQDEKPLAREFWDFLLDYNSGNQRDRLLARLEGMSLSGGFFGKLFTPSAWTLGGVVVAIAVAGAITGLVVLLRRLTWRRRMAAARFTVTIPFYMRLLRLLSRLRLQPRPVQTAREFASESAGILAGLPAAAPAADVPPEVVAAYYEVRFGARSLDPQEAAAVERNLDRLEQQLKQ